MSVAEHIEKPEEGEVMRYTIIGGLVGTVVVLCGAVWMRYQDARTWRDVGGKPNVSMLGSQFGSVGQGEIVSFEGVVGEVKSNGFVVIVAPPDHPPMAIGAINPADGVPDLEVGGSVRIEKRWYRMEVGDAPPRPIFVVTKRLDK